MEHLFDITIKVRARGEAGSIPRFVVPAEDQPEINDPADLSSALREYADEHDLTLETVEAHIEGVGEAAQAALDEVMEPYAEEA